MAKVIFVFTYTPDPRLIRKIRSFLKYSYEVELIFSERTHAINSFIEHELANVYKLEYVDSNWLIKRLYNLIKFFLNANRIINRSKPRIIYISGFDGLLVCYLGKWYEKAFIIYEVSDLPGGRWRRKNIFRRLIDQVDKLLSKYVDKIVMTSPYFDAGKYDKSKVTIIENLPEKRVFNKYKKIKHEFFTIGYFGLIRHERSLETLIRALGNLNDFKVLIAGKGIGDAYENIIKFSSNYNNVILKGPYNYEDDIVDLYSSVDCVYSVYDHDDENTNLALGNKLYEAIVCELPLLATKGSKMGDFVESNKIGFTVRADNPDDIKQAVLRLAGDNNIRDAIVEKCRVLKNNYFYEKAEEKLMSEINRKGLR